jgi:hypothetical protein
VNEFRYTDAFLRSFQLAVYVVHQWQNGNLFFVHSLASGSRRSVRIYLISCFGFSGVAENHCDLRLF